MNLYDMINISGKNTEDILRESIALVKSKLNNLTQERMCKVYNGYLLRELKKRHVTARLINTLDLNLDYEHVFVLVPANNQEYFLADLTFSQFQEVPKQLNFLLENSYQVINNDDFNCYINVVDRSKVKKSISINTAFDSEIGHSSNFKGHKR